MHGCIGSCCCRGQCTRAQADTIVTLPVSLRTGSAIVWACACLHRRTLSPPVHVHVGTSPLRCTDACVRLHRLTSSPPVPVRTCTCSLGWCEPAGVCVNVGVASTQHWGLQLCVDEPGAHRMVGQRGHYDYAHET